MEKKNKGAAMTDAMFPMWDTSPLQGCRYYHTLKKKYGRKDYYTDHIIDVYSGSTEAPASLEVFYSWEFFLSFTLQSYKSYSDLACGMGIRWPTFVSDYILGWSTHCTFSCEGKGRQQECKRYSKEKGRKNEPPPILQLKALNGSWRNHVTSQLL